MRVQINIVLGSIEIISTIYNKRSLVVSNRLDVEEFHRIWISVSINTSFVLEIHTNIIFYRINIKLYGSWNTIVFILCWKIFIVILSLLINKGLDFCFFKVIQLIFKCICNIYIEMCGFLFKLSNYNRYLLVSNPFSRPEFGSSLAKSY